MKEKKKKYRNPTQLTTKKLTDVLGSVFQKIFISHNGYLEEFIKDWPKIIGQDYAYMTEIMGYKQGTLVIKVNNSSLYSFLYHYHHKKQEILNQIRKNYPKWDVKDINFKIT